MIYASYYPRFLCAPHLCYAAAEQPGRWQQAKMQQPVGVVSPLISIELIYDLGLNSVEWYVECFCICGEFCFFYCVFMTISLKAAV